MIITPLHKWLVEGGETHSRSNEKSDIVWGGGGAAAEGLGQSVGSSETKLCAKTGGGDGECQGRHAQLTHRWGDNGSDPRQRGNISLSKPPRNDRHREPSRNKRRNAETLNDQHLWWLFKYCRTTFAVKKK